MPIESKPPGSAANGGSPDLVPALIDLGNLSARGMWDDEAVRSAGVPIVDAYVLTVGGGLGSFALVDFLRIAGLRTSDIRVLSNLAMPYETFAALAQASQLGETDRLRSDAGARIDNIWGWPSYAISEAFVERSFRPIWRVLTEPILSEFFTPRVGDVLAGLDREAARICWRDMLVPCWARVVRRRVGGGYFVLAEPLTEHGASPVAYRSHYVHLALGYPAPRFLPDLVAARQLAGSRRLVNGYEPHDHVYEELVRSGGRVLVRGSGITASRILERLISDRGTLGAGTQILHLFHTYVHGSVGPPWFRRPGGDGFAYQPFTFPKGAGGGQLRARTLALSAEERIRLVQCMGGTTTARRRHRQRQLKLAHREGWYRALAGCLVGITGGSNRPLTVMVRSDDGSVHEETVDHIIDATGLQGSVHHHALLGDLIDNGGAALNSLGRLVVEATFEVRGTRSGDGRVYASGMAALGGPLGPVDSFWGLTHAAMEICDDLADLRVCEFPGPVRSISQWWRWIRNEEP